jgi:hypothetical protein
MDDFERSDHPSYGMISFDKIQSRGRTLFGSDIKHDNFIKLQISEGFVNRGLNSNWYHKGGTIVEVYLTPTQFAEAISVGMDTQGIPCTIARREGAIVENPPEPEPMADKFTREYHADVDEYYQQIAEALEMVQNLSKKKGTISKKEINEVEGKLFKANQGVQSNLPYVKDQWDRALDQTITEGKAAIEAYIDGKVYALGLEAFKEDFKKMCGVTVHELTTDED